MSLKELAQAVVEGDAARARDLTEAALRDGMDPQQIVDEGFTAGMSIVGGLMKAGELYVPEVLMSARAMQAGLDVLKPLLAQSAVKVKGTAIVGTVYEDLHDIGKNLVASLLLGTGLKIVDVGKNVSPERFIASIKEHNADMLLLSCLLTTTMVNMRRTIEALRQAGLRDQVSVLVGGQPITQRFADEIGADGYAPTAAEAVDVVKALLGRSEH